MLDQLAEVERAALAELANLGGNGRPDEALAALDDWRVRYTGRKSAFTSIMRSVGLLPPEQRPAAGQAANTVKQRLEAAYVERLAELRAAALQRQLEAEAVDVTLPGRAPNEGHLHPLTLAQRDILRAFASMGFRPVDGPEVEWDYYNFTALNIPPNHPARDMWDTFWITDDMLLRTHTSPMQVRVLERVPPPVRVVIPGRCHRYESVDATHESTFFQIEGLMVDEQCTMAELKGTLSEMVRQLFGAERKTRFRCDYFPFVEPGAEMSMDCFVCGGAGCSLCKHSGWIEVLGAGMVHPNVFRAVGLDPKRYRGFAFGLGIDRVAMLKYGVDDLRTFYQNDVRFLHQFTYPAAAPEPWKRGKPA